MVGFGGRRGRRGGQPHFGKLHGAGLVDDVDAAASAAGRLLGREAEAPRPRPLHPPEGAVGGGGMGHAVMGAAGRPAGELGREELALAPEGQIPAVILGAVLEAAGDAPGPVGLDVPGLGAEGDGPPGEVAGKVCHRHRAVHRPVAVGGGVVEEDEVGEDGVVMAEAPQAHPDAHRVALAPDAALDADGHRAAVVDLLPQVFQIHPRLPAGVAAAARCGRRKGGVAGAAGGLIGHNVGHLLGQDVLAPAVHQRCHHQRQVHLSPEAGVVGGEAVFR